MDDNNTDNSFFLLDSVKNFIKGNNDLKDLEIYEISQVSKKIMPKSLRGAKWNHSGTILVGSYKGMNLKQIRNGIALQTKTSKRCYENSESLCGFYLDLPVWSYFFYLDNEIIHLFFCEKEYIKVYLELFMNSAISFDDIKSKKSLLNVKDRGYGTVLGT